MNAAHWQRVREVFLAALERPPDERAAFVNAACAGDDELLLEVRRLIGAQDDGDFLEPPQPERLADSLRALAGPVPGSTLGGYRLGAVLGSGGMGVVFRAVQLASDRAVAIKVLPPSLHLRPDAVERFKREARAASRLTHPNIVPVLDFGREEGCYFYAMELVDGASLAELLVAQRAGQGTLRGSRSTLDLADPRVCADVAALVADALEHAHRRGVVHRDVKPHNVLIDRDGTPKLVDFGLARDLDASGITREGDVAGTPHYMSPEQARSQLERIDHRTDVYSLGVVLYEMLTLQRPFEGGSSQEVYYKIAHSRSRPARAVRPTVPHELSAICQQAMRREPEDRYLDAAALAADLRRWLADEPVLARPPSLAARLRERAAEPRALLRVGPALLLAGLGAGWAWSATRDLLAERSRRAVVTLDLRALSLPVQLAVARAGAVPGSYGPFEVQRSTSNARFELPLSPGTALLRVRDATGRTSEFARDFAEAARIELSPSADLDGSDGMLDVPATRVRARAHMLVPRDVEVDVAPFRVDRDPVTIGEYLRFMEATGRERPRGWPDPAAPPPRPDWEDLPAWFLTFADARDYAEWRGKRLPTFWEWLALAGSTDAALDLVDVLGDPARLPIAGPPQGNSSSKAYFEGYVAHGQPVREDGGVPQGPYGLQFLFGNVCTYVDMPLWRHDAESGLDVLSPEAAIAMGLSWYARLSTTPGDPIHAALSLTQDVYAVAGNGIRCVESRSP